MAFPLIHQFAAFLSVGSVFMKQFASLLLYDVANVLKWCSGVAHRFDWGVAAASAVDVPMLYSSEEMLAVHPIHCLYNVDT